MPDTRQQPSLNSLLRLSATVAPEDLAHRAKQVLVSCAVPVNQHARTPAVYGMRKWFRAASTQPALMLGQHMHMRTCSCTATLHA
jgi:hypothetical protein